MPQSYDHRRDVIPEVAHRAYDHPAAAQPADMRDQILMDSLNRMMSELQGIKDQARSAMPRNPYPPTPHPGGEFHYNQ